MLPIADLTTPGEHAFLFQGKVGRLEAILTLPTEINFNHLALLGHPHSLQGGTMNNKVVTTMARAFKELGIPSIRFNFRGVGQSEGHYDAGIGESGDMLILQQLWQQHHPHTQFIFAGFSFGSFVAYRAAAQSDSVLLITIAPPFHHYNYTEFKAPNPWFILQGEEDDISPLDMVLAFANQANPKIPVIRFAKTGHFFHGNLLLLKSKLMDIVRMQVLSL
ncbi:alpha/beta hydrolase [Legionella sp. CNM-1927-20]|uniref:alpha/beta hydrolase n=1 Tax=Legionella sp. CNM-1927-20 TaxID=3422221 RepID=UPI00403AADE4